MSKLPKFYIDAVNPDFSDLSERLTQEMPRSLESPIVYDAIKEADAELRNAKIPSYEESPRKQQADDIAKQINDHIDAKLAETEGLRALSDRKTLIVAIVAATVGTLSLIFQVVSYFLL